MIQVPRLEDWYVETSRLTGFLPEGTAGSGEGLWKAVVGNEPEATIVRRAQGVRQDRGDFDGIPLALNTQSNRLDWLFSGAQSSDVAEKIGFQAVGDVEYAWRLLGKLTKLWHPHMAPFARIALGTVALLPVESRRDGYNKLRPLLPNLNMDLEASTDLLYRINRPRPSNASIGGLRLNRLATWTVEESQILAIEPTSPQTVASGKPTYACRVELDVNTMPEFKGTFDPSQSVKIIEECLTLASELIEKGDHK